MWRYWSDPLCDFIRGHDEIGQLALVGGHIGGERRVKWQMVAGEIANDIAILEVLHPFFQVLMAI